MDRAYPQQLLWTYIIQITSAMNAIHAAGLACRAIDLSKIIVVGTSRYPHSCIGESADACSVLLTAPCLADVLDQDRDAPQVKNTTLNLSSSLTAAQALVRQQQEDFVRLGHVIMQLACGLATITREQQQHVCGTCTGPSLIECSR